MTAQSPAPASDALAWWRDKACALEAENKQLRDDKITLGGEIEDLKERIEDLEYGPSPPGDTLREALNSERLCELESLFQRDEITAHHIREMLDALALSATSAQSDRAGREALTQSDFPKPQRKDGGEPCGECHIQPGETCDICGAAEPFAWRNKPPIASESWTITTDREMVQMRKADGWLVEPLYAAPQPDTAGREEPAVAWQLVPKKPTQAMLDALHDNIEHNIQTGYGGQDVNGNGIYEECSVLESISLPTAYEEMLTAAPVAPQPDTVGLERAAQSGELRFTLAEIEAALHRVLTKRGFANPGADRNE